MLPLLGTSQLVWTGGALPEHCLGRIRNQIGLPLPNWAFLDGPLPLLQCEGAIGTFGWSQMICNLSQVNYPPTENPSIATSFGKHLPSTVCHVTVLSAEDI